jgi:hypothetical protein
MIEEITTYRKRWKDHIERIDEDRWNDPAR